MQFDLRFFGVAHGDDAVFEVLIEQHERDAFHGAGGRGDLGEDVDAVTAIEVPKVLTDRIQSRPRAPWPHRG